MVAKKAPLVLCTHSVLMKSAAAEPDNPKERIASTIAFREGGGKPIRIFQTNFIPENSIIWTATRSTGSVSGYRFDTSRQLTEEQRWRCRVIADEICSRE